MLKMKSARSNFSLTTLSAVIALSSINIVLADGVQAWCGNGCSSDPDAGIACTDWEPGSSSSSCQAKAICSSECTVWSTANKGVDRMLRLKPTSTEHDLTLFQQQVKGVIGVQTMPKSKFWQQAR